MTSPELQKLARLHGVLPAYRDGFHQDRRPDDDALRAVLKDLGAEIDDRTDASEVVRATVAHRWSQLCEPVIASWANRPIECLIRVPAPHVSERVHASLRTESGEYREWSEPVSSLPVRRLVTVDGRRFAVLRFPVARSLSLGYHHLGLRVRDITASALVIRAPLRCPGLARTWGVFMPLYALHSQDSPAVGTFRELGSLIEWVQDLGGGLVSTLPLLASFLDKPFAPSPYTPVSRRFWNEFYLDLRQVPEWLPEMGGIQEMPTGSHVDYRTLMCTKRLALERAASRLEGERQARFHEFLDTKPELRDYAAFRAGVERGERGDGPFNGEDPACRYHAFAQWLAEEQIAKLGRAASRRGPGLYLDLPLGTHPRGFDSFRHPAVFAPTATGGAPPDRFFSRGQDWGFAPVNPWRSRESGHAYFISCVRHHLEHAGVLRIDHMMGLHRMYWIPRGFDGDQGTYVRYPADELYAIVCLESARHGTAVVGEDLGTVPAYVRQCMAAHGIRRTYVAQFEFRSDRDAPFTPPPADAVVSVNTHDTATFSAFWSGKDIDDQEMLGLLDEPHASDARQRRHEVRKALAVHFDAAGSGERFTGHERAVLGECLQSLSASDADCVIVTLEDLWGEILPQNTPGTSVERPNWTRRGRIALEEIRTSPSVLAILHRVNQVRSRRHPDRSGKHGADS